MFYSVKYKSQIKPQFYDKISKVEDILWSSINVYLKEPSSDYKYIL